MLSPAKIFTIASVTSWALYVAIFPYENLVSGPPLFWLLIFFALAALVTNVLSIARPPSRGYAILMIVHISALIFLYVTYWGKSVMTMAPALQSDLIGAILSVLRTKMKLVSNWLATGRILDGAIYSYWEFMPFLQIFFLAYWSMKSRDGKSTPAGPHSRTA
jgi:hypothetical protein